MGIFAAIAGGIGGLCAILGIVTVLEVFPDPIITVLGIDEWMFWFGLSMILLLGSIAMSLGRGHGSYD